MNIALLGAALTLVLTTAPVMAQNVKITPVGSHAGELCANDRATIFEDPTGVRIPYDAGQTVTGAPRVEIQLRPSATLFYLCASNSIAVAMPLLRLMSGWSRNAIFIFCLVETAPLEHKC